MVYIKFKKEEIMENKRERLENVVEKELENGNLYELFLTLNLGKFDKLILTAKTQKEVDFYNKLYEIALQTKQAKLIEKGIF